MCSIAISADSAQKKPQGSETAEFLQTTITISITTLFFSVSSENYRLDSTIIAILPIKDTNKHQQYVLQTYVLCRLLYCKSQFSVIALHVHELSIYIQAILQFFYF